MCVCVCVCAEGSVCVCVCGGGGMLCNKETVETEWEVHIIHCFMFRGSVLSRLHYSVFT